MEEQENGVLKPRNTWELLRWVIYEPRLFNKYSDGLNSWTDRLLAGLKIYGWLVFFSFYIYVVIAFFISFTDLPIAFPELIKQRIVYHWTPEWQINFQIFIQESILYYISVLLLGLGPLIWLCAPNSYLAYDSFFNFSLATGISAGFIAGFALNIGISIILGLALAISFGTLQIHVFHIISLVSGIGGTLAFAYGFDSTTGVTFLISWVLVRFRIPWWLYYSLRSSLNKYSLKRNPLHYDRVIAFPIFGLKETISNQAFENPEAGHKFADFLLRQREWQRQLAIHIKYVSAAGNLNQNRLDVSALRNLPIFIMKKDEKYTANHNWDKEKELLTQQLDDSQKSNNIWQRKKYFEQFNETLNRFYETTLRESPRWNKYYLIALERWKKSATDQLRDLELEAQTQEPICPNIYRGGEKLDPSLDKPLFLGRDDLRDTFKSRVLTAQQMPLFFIQGQRRTGKSSLLNFLPDFLDRGFRVVQLDLQTLGKTTVPGFFQAVYHAVCQTALPTPLDLPENWVEAWQVLKKTGSRSRPG
ncbi:MAG: hypothetical protein H6574_01765 [Lewinellaceae bacterium]|nr:hypothetical protein [Lewinellaceae bacterium]